MTGKKLQRLLACLLAVLLLSQVGAFSPAVFAADDGNVKLHDGAAIIKSTMTDDEVKEALARALVEGFDQMSADEQQKFVDDHEWQYECEGKSVLLTNTAWGSIFGFKSTKKVGLSTKEYEHPALAANADDDYKVRLKNNPNEVVTLTKAEKLSSSIALKDGVSVALPYTDDATVDYDALRASILAQVVEASTPALTVDNTTIEYYATATIGSPDWVALEGETKELIKVYPAISAGEQKIKVTFNGSDTYFSTYAEATVTFTERPSVQVTQKENPTFKLAFNDDGTANYDSIQQQVFDAVIASTDPALTANDVTIEYYATATSGSVGDAGKAWAPLKGGKIGILTYPAISEGTQKVRISYPGSRDYAPFTIEADVVVTGRADAPFQLKEGVTEVAMVYNKDQSINYEATAQALRAALLESTDPAVSINDVTVEYKALGAFEPLDYEAKLDSNKFGLGAQTIRFTWSGNADYKSYKQEVKVDVTDNRIVSVIVLKEGASITYNMDASVMEQAIFENLIDWDASTLPEKSTLSPDDFTISYYAEAETGSLGELGKDWAPIGGGKVSGLTYPQMGAGENQQIRVTFKGNEAYRPCKDVEGTLTVNKAKVSVKVHTTSIYADEKPGEGFITTDPADKFDIYTIYGGVTSDVTTSVFVQLPDRLTNSTVLKMVDEALKLAGQPTLTEMMQNGTTVGELRKILSDVISKGDDLPTFIKDALKSAGIDIDTLVKLNDALGKLPSLLDDVRVAFGTPDQAGLYVVTAVTNNKNYETGVGTGMLLVKKHYSGVKLEWNQTITNGKMTAAEAAEFDFGVTLTYNGEPAAKQDNVHYLYSGFTSKWKLYSSTTTPPTEPGRYVVTVVTLGGNYQAAPITRAFQITK